MRATRNRQHHATVINTAMKWKKNKRLCTNLDSFCTLSTDLLAYTSPIRDKYAKFLNSLHLKVIYGERTTHAHTHTQERQ